MPTDSFAAWTEKCNRQYPPDMWIPASAQNEEIVVSCILLRDHARQQHPGLSHRVHLRVMAFSGHISWQQKQVMQLAESSTG